MAMPKLKAAIYCRVAYKDQLKIESQMERLKHIAEENGFTDVIYYYDNGFSGLDFDRPSFSEMVAAIQAGTIGTVIVQDESRIGRDPFAVSAWINDWNLKGIRLITIQPLSESHSVLNDIFTAYMRKQRMHKSKAV